MRWGAAHTKDLGNFLKSRTLGLDVDEVDNDELNTDPAGVHAVELPLFTLPDTVHRDGVDLVVDDKGELHSKVHNDEALCTKP